MKSIKIIAKTSTKNEKKKGQKEDQIIGPNKSITKERINSSLPTPMMFPIPFCASLNNCYNGRRDEER